MALLKVIAASAAIMLAHAAEGQHQPFTVQDSIALPRVINFVDYAVNLGDTALFNADQSQFVIQLRRGVLARNVNVEALLLFETRDVRAWLASAAAATQPAFKIVVQREVAEDWGKVSAVQWLDNAELGFIAQDASGLNQAFVSNTRTGAVTQITHAATHVVAFAAAADSILYYAYAQDEPARLVESVGDRELLDVLFSKLDRSHTSGPLEMLAASRSNGTVTRIARPAFRLSPAALQIWPSPSGRYAVTLTPAVNSPGYWAEYAAPADLQRYPAKGTGPSAESFELLTRARYQLVDLRRNVAKPLLDAPDGSMSWNRTPQRVFWSGDERFVIVSNTYLPLGDTSGAQRERRRAGPGIAEIDLQTGEVAAVLWEPRVTDAILAGKAQLEPIVSLDWDPAVNRLSIGRKVSDDVTYDLLERRHARWRRIGVGTGEADAPPSIQRLEGLNERPKVYATGGACSCKKLLFDPAPQADGLTFGRAEVVTWTDRNDIVWHGTLIHPPHFSAGDSYPLVVQTHGFHPNKFLIDGPGYGDGGTAMAAQALANSGFLVLQVEDNPRAITLDAREASRVAEGYRAGIESLTSRGLVDSDKIGMIAFSRTGLAAVQFLADYPNLLAAIDISDGSWWGYLFNLLLVNATPDLRREATLVTGGEPDLATIEEWFARNPLYRLPNARAAVRFEENGISAGMGFWEHYSLLRKAGRPVEYILFPHGSHVLQKPGERLHSGTGNVDWFRFWLQGYERPEPIVEAGETKESLAEQYARWRKLREMQRAVQQP